MVARGELPSLSDLYLAFRQAKAAHFYEKRGVGLLGFAQYESALSKNLKALQKKLAKRVWFDGLALGEVWLVPKRLRAPADIDDGVLRIGVPHGSAARRGVDVQLRLSPTADFAIAEVLYLWRFGGILDALLAKPDVLGYRLDLRNGRIAKHRRWLFEYWPSRYQEFRTAPLAAARRALGRREEVLVISGDLASFYDTVNPAFMLSEPFLLELERGGASAVEIDGYKQATESLLGAYGRFHKMASSRASSDVSVGVPIGPLTSRLVANLSLATLDRHIASRPEVICYRRYVDDLVIVARPTGESGVAKVIERFLPVAKNEGRLLRLDAVALARRGSEFELQEKKIRVHHLAGIPGTDFVDAIASDFAKAVSERRAFIDSSVLLGDGVTHLIRAGEGEGSPLRVLRDADRTRLERFALSTSLHSLERVSSLIGRVEARELVRGHLERLGRVLNAEDDWVNDLDVSFRLLKLAISTGDWDSASELRQRMDVVWGTVAALKSSISGLFYRGREIDPRKVSPWTWLRNYLHERRIEAISSAIPLERDAASLESRFPGGVVLRTRLIQATALRNRAVLLALADLRARDHEDDGLNLQTSAAALNREWMRAELAVDPQLADRLTTIDRFVERCEKLDDRPWLMPAARLFLCTRPPSYFDIARRWLYRVEWDGFDTNLFDELLAMVNAVRGTEYRDPVGRAVDQSTVAIESVWATPAGLAPPPDPRIILGNLVVPDEAWVAAAKRIREPPYNKPLVNLQRLAGVARVLEKASRVAQGHASAVLILPELSLPRQWFRTVANHVVRLGRFGLVAGLEYWHDPKRQFVSNQVFAVIPGPFLSAATWPWTKLLPAREEGARLESLTPPLSFAPVRRKGRPRTVVQSPWGAFSVLICSELLEARRIADLLGRVDLVLCPAWNPDTASYDHLIQTVGFQLHSVVAIANNGQYSDCRAWAPRSERWERDLCRLIERDVDDVVHVDIPLSSLVAFHGGTKQTKDRYARLRAALGRRDIRAARAALEELTEQLPGLWRPLPPDWS